MGASYFRPRGNKEALLSDLLFPNFIKRFTIYAQCSRGTRLQTFQADFDSATFTITVITSINFGNSLVYFLDQLALPVTITQFQGHIRLLASTIIRIGENGGLVLHRVHRAI